jgi:hypothetical protein
MIGLCSQATSGKSLSCDYMVDRHKVGPSISEHRNYSAQNGTESGQPRPLNSLCEPNFLPSSSSQSSHSKSNAIFASLPPTQGVEDDIYEYLVIRIINRHCTFGAFFVSLMLLFISFFFQILIWKEDQHGNPILTYYSRVHPCL